ncbi:hypothetical protein [Alicyclobacillus sp. ALC3]|nr:hypothetical protein [Alicyclobacillus sp. ALC3]WDL97403.1 hypothetical protein JC200_01290 [Alicyclobacillus sp. ALC3]
MADRNSQLILARTPQNLYIVLEQSITLFLFVCELAGAVARVLAIRRI